MKSTALAPSSTMEATLTVMSGPARGTAYRLVSSRVKLGRGSDNDIVTDHDPKSSRHHAEIVVTPRGIEIRDVSDRNQIIVDGIECKAAFLNDGSVFTLGDTQFRFGMKMQVPALSPQDHMQPTGGWHMQPAHKSSGQKKRKAQKPAGPKILLIVAGAFIAWLLLSGSPNDTKKNPTADEQIEAEMKTAQELKTAAEVRRKTNVGGSEVAYNEAQQAFVAGFRDYRKGQFERAMTSFQACVSLQPSHELCNRYLRVTMRKFDELVQDQMVWGRKYRDQNQFAACKASFRNVMVMVKDATSKRYKEAKANYDACSAQLEERF